jgi:hypothetical protein
VNPKHGRPNSWRAGKTLAAGSAYAADRDRPAAAARVGDERSVREGRVARPGRAGARVAIGAALLRRRDGRRCPAGRRRAGATRPAGQSRPVRRARGRPCGRGAGDGRLRAPRRAVACRRVVVARPLARRLRRRRAEPDHGRLARWRAGAGRGGGGERDRPRAGRRAGRRARPRGRNRPGQPAALARGCTPSGGGGGPHAAGQGRLHRGPGRRAAVGAETDAAYARIALLLGEAGTGVRLATHDDALHRLLLPALPTPTASSSSACVRTGPRRSQQRAGACASTSPSGPTGSATSCAAAPSPGASRGGGCGGGGGRRGGAVPASAASTTGSACASASISGGGRLSRSFPTRSASIASPERSVRSPSEESTSRCRRRSSGSDDARPVFRFPVRLRAAWRRVPTRPPVGRDRRPTWAPSRSPAARGTAVWSAAARGRPGGARSTAWRGGRRR